MYKRQDLGRVAGAGGIDLLEHGPAGEADHELAGIDGVGQRIVVAHRSELEDGRHGTGHGEISVSYTHLRAHETVLDLVCRLLLEKKNKKHIEPKPISYVT